MVCAIQHGGDVYLSSVCMCCVYCVCAVWCVFVVYVVWWVCGGCVGVWVYVWAGVGVFYTAGDETMVTMLIT